MRSSIVASALTLLASTAYAVNTVEVRGQDFVDSVTNDRFVIIGVDYQPGGASAYSASNDQDPLSNSTTCLRDAALLQHLGVNTIRVYNTDPTLNHDECVSIFNSVGIYMIIDVNSPLYGQSIDRSDPSSSYTTGYLEHIFTVVEAYKSYPNLLGFFAGNEIINDVETGGANPPIIRAVQRDLKNYIANHADRKIPVGYSAADVREVLEDSFNYFYCNNDDNSSSDFFGLNSYSWCGSESSFQTSGYDNLVAMFSDSSIPVFFSEYGCNDPTPRVFDEVQAIYGPQMTALSGGLVYEFSQESNNYGLVQIYSNNSVQLLNDFNALQGQYNQINITLLENSNATATNLTAPTCTSSLISSDGFSTDFDIPSPPQGGSALISSGVSNAPTGSIVSVTATAVAFPVYDVNGASISGLAITTTSGANIPGGSSIGGSATSRASSSGTGSSSSSRTGSSSSSATTGSSSSSGTRTASGSAAATSSGAANAYGVSSGAAAAAAGLVALFAL